VETDDALWKRLHTHFTEPEIVRTLNIQHHALLAGTSASMAPGFEDAATAEDSLQDKNYWAKDKTPGA